MAKKQIMQLEDVLNSCLVVHQQLNDLRQLDPIINIEFTRLTLEQAVEITTEDISLMELALNPINPKDTLPTSEGLLLIDGFSRLLLGRDGLETLLLLLGQIPPDMTSPEIEALKCSFVALYNQVQNNLQITIYNIASYLQLLSAGCLCATKRRCHFD